MKKTRNSGRSVTWKEDAKFKEKIVKDGNDNTIYHAKWDKLSKKLLLEKKMINGKLVTVKNEMRKKRVVWNEYDNVKEKLVYNENGIVIYHAKWDKTTKRKLVEKRLVNGKLVDIIK